jgi:hypothetical protein
MPEVHLHRPRATAPPLLHQAVSPFPVIFPNTVSASHSSPKCPLRKDFIAVAATTIFRENDISSTTIQNRF